MEVIMKFSNFLKQLAFWIIVISGFAGAYYTHLVILNIKSYSTLGVEASGNANWVPVIVCFILLISGLSLYKTQFKIQKTCDSNKTIQN